MFLFLAMNLLRLPPSQDTECTENSARNLGISDSAFYIKFIPLCLPCRWSMDHWVQGMGFSPGQAY